MDDCLVSVIVPIYNVEEYIKKTVESIINQDYKRMEIILVDDGSPDSCPQIVDELKQQDDRIVVVHKKNGGVSSARNAGLDIAKGDYIVFVDGDDWLEPNCVSYLLSLVIDYKCEIGLNKNQISDYNTKSSNRVSIISSEKAIEWLYLGKIDVAVWNKIFDRTFIDKNRIRFNETIWYGEGMLFNIICLQEVKQVVLGEMGVYHQVSNPNSAMRKFDLNNQYCGIRSLELQKQYWKKVNKAIINSWNLHRRDYNISIMLGLVKTDNECSNERIFENCALQLRNNLKYAMMADISIARKLMYILWAISPYMMSNYHKKKNGLKISEKYTLKKRVIKFLKNIFDILKW